MRYFKKAASLVLFMFLMTSSAQGSQPIRPNADSPGKYDVALMISATTIMQKLKQKKRIFLVDIRHEAEFNKFKIPGSINIPLAFIKTKPFLKQKPIVIVHKGFGYEEMIKETRTLKENGFDIKILEGGLLAWKHKGGDIVGDPFSQKEINRMPASAFFMEKDHEEWVIINACSKPSETVNTIIPKAVHLPMPQYDEKAGQGVQPVFSDKNVLEQNLAVLKNNPMMSVIIFNETGNDYDQLEYNINKAFEHKVFFLEGGIEAYQRFLNFQTLANKPKSERIKETGHCEPCKKKDNP